MFSKKEIATYYNHTLLHYKVGWQLRKSMGLHYGLWYNDTKDLHEAIQNTNKKVADFFPGKENINILDAGCGVGGTAIYLVKNYHCTAKGITLSPVQQREGTKYVEEAGLTSKIELSVQDYTATNFDDNSFDVVFGIESFCHADEKAEVYREAFRLLKPGGTFVMIDSIKTEKGKLLKYKKTVDWLLSRWAINDLDDGPQTFKKLAREGFDSVQIENLTKEVLPSIRRIYRRAFWGLITIPLYTIIFPTKYHFTRRHPESGWALHKCFRKNLLEYVCISGRKPH
jgi:cyclopropane fatty-acyl-phospholipid synthase-like methyltransferase